MIEKGLTRDVIQGTPFPQHLNQTGCRGITDRVAKPSTRVHPYQHHGARQASPTWESGRSSGSPEHLSPMASGSRTGHEGSDFATSPGADSDPYYSFPNTPGNTNGLISESEETTRVSPDEMKIHFEFVRVPLSRLN